MTEKPADMNKNDDKVQVPNLQFDLGNHNSNQNSNVGGSPRQPDTPNLPQGEQVLESQGMDDQKNEPKLEFNVVQHHHVSPERQDQSKEDEEKGNV